MAHASELPKSFFVGVRLSRFAAIHDCLETESDPTTSSPVSRIGVIVEQRGGRILTQTDNELACTFDDLLAAVEATRTIHKQLTPDLSASGGCLRLSLFEPAIRTDSGAAVTSAIAKMRQLAGLAGSGQTLACVQDFGPIENSMLREEAAITPPDWHDDACVPRSTIRQILWQDETPTRLAIAGISASPITRTERLVLRWRDQRFELDNHSSPVTMGRSSSAGISINSDFASRDHAQVSYAHATFVLADHSTNGTYVSIDDNEVYIHGDEIILRGDGCISLGRRASSAKGKVVYFSTETAAAPTRGERTDA